MSMQQHPRYEVLGLIGNGDFAAVYRARDRELGRDVAIKQIHGQYMHDPAKLARFWREAQLLATLAHPHIMTIYDIVRPRGWLVLELMQGTVLDACKGEPIDLMQLRAVLVGALQGLSMLHNSGVIHGDIKPSNLLLDRRGQVKLGDFGLARRVANDQGSYLKGATRYMAPELAAPQFGGVGPASDLYSLGFAAYELLCGPKQFEELFPGLEAFGRDRQVAWMMWHAAPDRQLPPVSSVLDGVPPDVAKVIDRLTRKDQAKRYRTAEQALADLGDAPLNVPVPDADDEDIAKSQRQKRQRRMIAIMALAASVLLSVIVAVLPTEKRTVASPPAAPAAVQGVVRMLDSDGQVMIVEQPGGRGPKEYRVHSDDRVYLNNKASLLRELREADQVTVETLRDEQGQPLLEIRASRPQEERGTIADLRPDDGEFSVALAGADSQLQLSIGASTTIEINGALAPGDKSFLLSDLKAGDHVSVVHFRDQDRDTAVKVSAVRMVSGEGVVRGIDLKKKQVSIAAGPQEGAAVTDWPLADKVDVSLNGRKLIASRPLTVGDLRLGDRVTFDRDVKLINISAQRRFSASGTIRALNYDVKSFTTTPTSPPGGDRTFVLAPECMVSLGGESVAFDDLRRGDTFEAQFDDFDAVSPSVVSIAAQRPADRTKWAVVIASGSFEDSSVPVLPTVATTAASLEKTLTARYAIPAEQVIALTDPSRVRMQQGLADAIAKIGSASQLLVVIAGRVVPTLKTPLVVPKDFDHTRPDVTGVPLAALLTEIDKCPANDKIVVLDLAAAPLGPQSSDGPTIAALVDSVRGTRSRPLLKSTAIIAADESGTRKEAALAAALSGALAGAADADRDNHVTAAELNEYLKSSAGAGTVRLILPDTTPPRLSDDAKSAIRRLAASASKEKVDKADATLLTIAAEKLAPKQPEPRLLGGILMLKARQHSEALAYLEQVVADHPRTPLAWELMAWAHFDKLNFSGGLNDLAQLVRNLPEGKLSDNDRRALVWAGRLREFAGTAAAPDRRPGSSAIADLDRAITERGTEAVAAFEQGREAARAVANDFDKKAKDATDSNEQLRLKFERQTLRHYVSFSLESAAQQAVAGLDAD
jgi:hypothetical protein